MKKIFLIPLAFSILGGVCSAEDASFVEGKGGIPPSETTANSASLKVGILDFNKVWAQAKAPAQVRDDIQAKRRKYQREIITLEEKLRRQEEDLQKESKSESAQAYQDRRKAFEAEVLAVQKKVQIRKQQLEKTFNKAMGEVTETLNKVIEEIAESRGLDMVLSQAHVAFFNDEKLNITPSVIEKLDAQLPRVKMENF